MDIGEYFESTSGEANEPKKERNYKKTSWCQCQCSGSSQIPSQDDLNYHQFLSLYATRRRNGRTEFIIYDTENEKGELKVLDGQEYLDEFTSITQLSNGDLFCYGYWKYGTTLIIDRSYGVRKLPSGAPYYNSSALYFCNNIYCFGGIDDNGKKNLSTKFDLEKNRWIKLTRLPRADYFCHSVIFNRNILISGVSSKDLWLYSNEIDSFSIIPYAFKKYTIKLLINVERLYLIEWNENGLIYESEDEYHLKPISKSGKLALDCPKYCLHNKEKIYISTIYDYYYQFDLKKKVVLKINKY